MDQLREQHTVYSNNYALDKRYVPDNIVADLTICNYARLALENN